MNCILRTMHRNIALNLVACVLFVFSGIAIADDGGSDGMGSIIAPTGDAAPVTTDSVMPDLFTGTMKYSVLIKVPPGRKGMTPAVSLDYRSSNGNGWLGVGWDLEMGAIERSTRKGLTYDDATDQFLLKGSGGGSELVKIPATNRYALKIEPGMFARIVKTGNYWEVTYKTGTRYLYGDTQASQLYDLNNTARIFRWCLSKIIDTNGNTITFSYTKDLDGDRQQIYLSEIAYTGNEEQSLAPASIIKFLLENRTDSPTLYTANFAVKTAKRLKTIEVWGNSALVRKYVLNYDSHFNDGYSPITGRSVLAGITEYGSDSVTALPPVTFDYSNEYTVAGGAATGGWTEYSPSASWSLTATQLPSSKFCLAGYFGYVGFDILCSTTNSSDNWDIKALLHHASPEKPYTNWTNGRPPALTMSLGQQCIAGDFRGDGIYSFACNKSNNGDWIVATTDGDYGSYETWQNGLRPGLPVSQCFAGDFNGDGKTDITCYTGSQWQMALSTGTGWTGGWAGGPSLPTPTANCLTGDFDGNHQTDLACNSGNSNSWSISLSNGSGWTPVVWESGSITVPALYQYQYPLSGYCRPGDFNGDGKTDIACFLDNAWKVMVSTGNGWDTTFAAGGPETTVPIYQKSVFGDFNGDGKTDIACYGWGSWNVGLSTGSGWDMPSWTGGPYTQQAAQECFVGDFSGADGKTDIICRQGASWGEAIATAPAADLLTHISNGIGGEIAITYSSAYSLWSRLIYPVQTVKSITLDDGNGNSGTTSYYYTGGYYHPVERDFRGFNYVRATGPSGNGGAKVIETYFHQGNGTTAYADDPSVANAYMKGKPYLTRIKDNLGKVYSETETIYRDTPNPNPNPYHFNPPQQVDTYVCDGNAVGYGCKAVARRTYSSYTYDDYGNVTREDRFGDPSNPGNTQVNMTVEKQYASNTDSWIVGLPLSESVFAGIGNAATGNQLLRRTNYYYDGDTDCSTLSENQLPTKGNLTRISRWLDVPTADWVDTLMTYDAYGNLACVRDPNGKTVSTVYDTAAQTFPITTTAPIPEKGIALISTQGYYGVEGNAVDKGSFGLPRTVTDPNNAVTVAEYDKLGRKSRDTLPDEFWTTTAYKSFGAVNSQHLRTDNKLGLWSKQFFDGFGRAIKEERSGPEGKTIVTETGYEERGLVSQISLPYFAGLQSPLYRTYEYDVLGRVTQITNPDLTKTMTCYNDLVTVHIDENFHRKRETRDPLGRLVTVEEYKGVYSTCSTAQVDQGQEPYATTTYNYDALGNLTGITDTRNNVTTIQYDSLGRKTSMSDPDMGNWGYTYYPDSSVHTVTDSIAQTTTFTYDSLNRVRTKQYPKAGGTGTVTYNYDEAAYAHSLGRLTSMLDESGSTTWGYDISGRPATVTKSVDGIAYPVSRLYDGLGRVTRITYPDSFPVDYRYDLGGNLSEVVYFAQFIDYNASGQPGAISYANGATTWFQYNPFNLRLVGLENDSPDWILDSFGYLYDNKGNLTQITSGYTLYNDLLPSTTDYSSAGHNMYYQIKSIPSSDATIVSEYVSNGNGNPFEIKSSTRYGMEIWFTNNRLITYNADNMPLSITTHVGQPNQATTSFVYDGNNKRVKKIAPGYTRLYIDKLYECVDGNCGKFIFAGNMRIAGIFGGATYYYQPDHQGSTSSITDTNGEWVESIAYYPFGETRQEDLAGPLTMTHKYTGQELDDETGLYNYGARLYDPAVGRFLTPDSIVPDYRNPQSLNRYSYTLNTPLRYNDPTGHSWDDVSDLFSSAWSGIKSFFSEFSDLSYDSGNPTANASYSMNWNNYQSVTFDQGQYTSAFATNDFFAQGQSYDEANQICSVPSSQGFNPSGDQIVGMLGFGATNIGTMLSVAGSASPSATAGTLVADITFNSASNVFGFAPNQRVSDIGGFVSSAAGTGVGMAATGGEFLYMRALTVVGTRTVPTLGLAVSAFGTGVATGTLVNHFLVYGTNQNVQQWWSDYIWNTFGTGRGIR